jgi:hypothetical protein
MSIITKQQAAPRRPMMTPEEAGARAAHSLSTIWRSGLPKYKVGRLVRFHPDDVEELARSRGRAA